MDQTQSAVKLETKKKVKKKKSKRKWKGNLRRKRKKFTASPQSEKTRELEQIADPSIHRSF